MALATPNENVPPASLEKYHSSRVLLLAYQPFAFVIISVLAFNEAKINPRLRNLFGYILFFLSSLSILVLNLASSGKGGLGVVDGHVHGGMLGELFFMQYEFIQSFVAGLAAAGALASALRLVTKAAFENTRDGLRKGALLFFAISSFFEFLCVLIYAFVFPNLPIVKYYRLKTASEGSKTVSADLAAGGIQTIPAEEDPEKLERLSNKELLLQNIDHALDIFLLSLLTLSIFPGFLYEDTGKHSLGTWYALVLIAMFNVWNLIGRCIRLLKFLKLESRKGLMIATLSRFVFIPAFYFTAKYGDQGWMIMLSSFLGLTFGYLSVCVLTTAPKGYKVSSLNDTLRYISFSKICY
ncbi:hypothetical protein RGQ29_031794 [Quercus rubra]|uniref:Equilibrative nucleoside transporter n=1 Tax=Quercus rubra TaxID=3512 RepID=A0AAN7I5J1_QUERU|nr:hypothetical protein RGQ29_031794 [Quercus rubra]